MVQIGGTLTSSNYDMRMATHEEALELGSLKTCALAAEFNKISLFTYDEIIFVDESVKGKDILTFMKSIWICINLRTNPVLLHLNYGDEA